MSHKLKCYRVGGYIRDELLGVKPKDIDYTIVLEPLNPCEVISISESLEIVELFLKENNYTIFLKSLDTYTFRAKNNKTNEIADFVLARHELGYNNKIRKPHTILGTLEQDLGRRDFTINAMAKDEFGNLIDLFNEQEDLSNHILRTPYDPIVTLLDDPLRLLRALRFSITKEMVFDPSLWIAFKNPQIYEKMWKVVSQERIRDELYKMFSFDTEKSLKLLFEFSEHIKSVYPSFLFDIFNRSGLWLKPTTEKIKCL